METIDYTTRTEMVAALMDARKNGVTVEVVGNGRTLKFPDSIAATAEDDDDEDLQQEKEVPADGIEKTPVEGDTLLGVVTPEEGTTLDRSTFTIEGTCSECGESAIAEPEGNTWIHVDAVTHSDNEGHFVPNEQVEEEKPAVEDEDEDLIGEPPPPVKAQPTKRSNKRSR